MLAVDIGYIVNHGFHAAAVGFTALTFLPAWVFLGRDVDVKFWGGGLKITGDELEKTVERANESAPRAVKQAEEQIPALRQEAKERTEGRRTLDTSRNSASLSDVQYYSGRDMAILEAQYGRNALASTNGIDPNLALGSLRIDIERRLNRLSEWSDLNTRNLRDLVATLKSLKVFDEDFASVLALHRVRQQSRTWGTR